MGTTTAPVEEPAQTPEQRAVGDDTTRLLDVLRARQAVNEGEAIDVALTRLLDDNARLRPLADDGARYRTDLIAEALAQGVRAYGDGFAQETYEGMLKAGTLDQIKRMRDDWRAIGDRALPGGRVTVEGDPPSGTTDTARDVPNAAFKD